MRSCDWPRNCGEGAEDPEEDVLGEVERLVAVAQQVVGQLEDHALVLVDQVDAGRFVALRTPGHQGRFAILDVLP